MKTFKGSCHCGRIKYQADIDLSRGTTRCNCSICSKLRFWGFRVKPAEFRLLEGEQAKHYEFGPGSIQHVFCGNCGVSPYYHGNLAVLGGEFYTINLGTLDDMAPEELAAAAETVHYVNGRDEDWFHPPKCVKQL